MYVKYVALILEYTWNSKINQLGIKNITCRFSLLPLLSLTVINHQWEPKQLGRKLSLIYLVIGFTELYHNLIWWCDRSQTRQGARSVRTSSPGKQCFINGVYRIKSKCDLPKKHVACNCNPDLPGFVFHRNNRRKMVSTLSWIFILDRKCFEPLWLSWHLCFNQSPFPSFPIRTYSETEKSRRGTKRCSS